MKLWNWRRNSAVKIPALLSTESWARSPADGKRVARSTGPTARPIRRRLLSVPVKKRLTLRKKAKTQNENNLFGRTDQPLCEKYVCTGFCPAQGLCKGRGLQL